MNVLAKDSPERQARLRDLLLEWQGSAYYGVTSAARALAATGAPLPDDTWAANLAVSLTRALYSLRPLAVERTVWSGLGRTANKAFRELPCSATLALTVPMSTSTDLSVAEGFTSRVDGVRYILEITIPAAARGAFIAGYEAELLLPPGTRLELSGDSYEYTTPEGKYGAQPHTYTVVKATVVGQRMPKWAR